MLPKGQDFGSHDIALSHTRGWHAVSLIEPARIIQPALFRSFSPEA